MALKFPVIRALLKKSKELMSDETRKEIRKNVVTGALGELASQNVKKGATSLLDKIELKRRK